MIPRNRAVALAVIVLSVAALGLASVFVLAAMGKARWNAPVLTGYGIALVLAVPGYLSLSWSLRRSNKVFYGVFVGGIFFRLSAFAATAFAVYRVGRWPMASVMLPFVFGLILSSFVEIYFIQKEAKA